MHDNSDVEERVATLRARYAFLDCMYTDAQLSFVVAGLEFEPGPDDQTAGRVTYRSPTDEELRQFDAENGSVARQMENIERELKSLGQKVHEQPW